MKYNIQNIQRKIFKIKELFDINIRGKRLTANNREEGKYPFITAWENKNGISSFIENQLHKSYNSSITLDMFWNAFYQDYIFKCDDNITVLSNKKINKASSLFIISILKRLNKKYSYWNQVRPNRLNSDKIILPVTATGEPDYGFMEWYMREQEELLHQKYQEYIRPRLASLTIQDNILMLSEKEWGEFEIEDIAEIIWWQDIYEKERIWGEIPYISATANNNWIGYYVWNMNKTYEKDYLSVNRNWSVWYCFYHPYFALVWNDCRKLRLYNKSKYVWFFISRIITNQKEKYGYGYKMWTARLKRQKILLPITSAGEADYDYMEQYMKQLELKKLQRYFDEKGFSY